MVNMHESCCQESALIILSLTHCLILNVHFSNACLCKTWKLKLKSTAVSGNKQLIDIN